MNWDWTQISRTIGEHSTHWTNALILKAIKNKDDCDTDNSWRPWNNIKKSRIETDGMRNLRKNLDCLELQSCWNQLEYWDEFWRSEEICCHMGFSKNYLLRLAWKLTKSKIIISIQCDRLRVQIKWNSCKLVQFVLISLFNGISALVGYLMLKLSW